MDDDIVITINSFMLIARIHNPIPKPISPEERQFQNHFTERIENFNDEDWDKHSIDMMSSVIGHELDHTTKQYIFPDKNLLLEKKPGSLFTDFSYNNIFKLDKSSQLYKDCQHYLYYISPDEQDAQITAYAVLLKKWSHNIPKYISKTFETGFQKNLYEICYDYDRRPGIAQQKSLCSTIIRYHISNEAHKLYYFQEQCSKLDKLIFDDEYNLKLLHIIGYYIFKHNTIKNIQSVMLKFMVNKPKTYQSLKDKIYKFFKYDEITKHLNGDKPYS